MRWSAGGEPAVTGRGGVAAGRFNIQPRFLNRAGSSTLGCGLHPETPAYDLQRHSGFQACAFLRAGSPRRAVSSIARSMGIRTTPASSSIQP